MAYDHEEQEQLAALQGWWADNGKFVAALLLAVAVGTGGWFGWRAWQASEAQAAGVHYEALLRAAQANDAKAMRESAGVLAEGYGRTLYASMGALTAAKFLFERGDLKGARAQLQWVAERGASEEMRDIARLRLAAVLLDEKSYDEALKVLEAKHAAVFDPQYALMRGDILLAKGSPAEAKAAYQKALEQPGTGEGFRSSVQMRLDAIGG